jgi:5S rRNA maturation endonuclease (ribonuclease M5)
MTQAELLWQELLENLSVKLRRQGNKWIGRCPIHDGHKQSFYFYPDGNTNKCFYTCYSRHCSDSFTGNIVGLVQAILSKERYGWTQEGDKKCPWKESVDYICEVLEIDYEQLEYNYEQAKKQRDLKVVETLAERPRETSGKICTRQQIRKILDIPSKNFIDRGFSAEILDKYCIGLCTSPKSSLYNRIVVPFFDENNPDDMIGAIGRTIQPECNKCGLFHPEDMDCPDRKREWVKWCCSKDFNDKNYLFNWWFSKEKIWEKRNCVIVEGSLDCLKLEMAGIHNSVALGGSQVSDVQQAMFEMSGAITVCSLLDNDEAGENCYKNLQNKLLFQKIIKINFEGHDIGGLPIEYIKKIIKPQIERYNK